jgi:hypothetical protein
METRPAHISRPEGTGTALVVRLQPHELQMLDDWIESHTPDHRPPSRSAAMRWLLMATLKP